MLLTVSPHLLGMRFERPRPKPEQEEQWGIENARSDKEGCLRACQTLLRCLALEIDHEIMTYVPQEPFEIATHDVMRDISEYKHTQLFLFDACFSPDNNFLALTGFSNVLVVDSYSGRPVTEYTHSGYFQPSVTSVSFSTDRRLSISTDDKKIKSVDLRTGQVMAKDEQEYSEIIPPKANLWVTVEPDKMVRITHSCTADAIQYKHSNPVASAYLSPDNSLLALIEGQVFGKIIIKSMIPLLLARYCGAQTIEQYLFVKELQQQLLCEKACHLECKKSPLIIGQKRRNMLEDMPDLKRLLKIERSLSQTQNQLWCLSLQERVYFEEQGEGINPVPNTLKDVPIFQSMDNID